MLSCQVIKAYDDVLSHDPQSPNYRQQNRSEGDGPEMIPDHPEYASLNRILELGSGWTEVPQSSSTSDYEMRTGEQERDSP